MSISPASCKPATIPAEGCKTRRAALGALIAAGALAVPTVGAIAAAVTDPIFGAVACHKAAYDATLALGIAIDDLINNPAGSDVADADWDAYDRARVIGEEFFDKLLSCTPRCLTGARAIITYLVYLDDGRLSEKMRRLLAQLLQSEALTR